MPVGTGAYTVPTQQRVVTTRYPYGPGSFYEAVTAPMNGAGAVITFAQGGTINYIGRGDVIATQPGTQIDGTSATDNGGVTIIGNGFRMKSRGGVLKGVRIMPADYPTGTSPDNRDCVGIEGEAQVVEDITVQNCTLAYAIDGLLDLQSTRIARVSLLDNFFVEPLNQSIHSKGAHSTCLLIGLGATDVLIAGNLFANYVYRAPAIRGPSNVGFAGNVYYNPRDTVWILYGPDTGQPGGTVLLSLWNNMAIMGPSSPWFRSSPPGKFEVINGDMSSFTNSRVYYRGNQNRVSSTLVAQHAAYASMNAWPTTTPKIAALPYALISNTDVVNWGSYTPPATADVVASVLANAGCPTRTLLENRIIDEVTYGVSGSIKDTVPIAEAEYFGLPPVGQPAPPRIAFTSGVMG